VANPARNVYQTRVRSHQTDLNAAMYHGSFFDMYDDARIEMFRQMGYTYEDTLREEWAVVIRCVECEYHAPAMMDDAIEIHVGWPQFTRASMLVEYRCLRDGVLLARGIVVYVFVNLRRRPIRVPARLRELVNAYGHELWDITTA